MAAASVRNILTPVEPPRGGCPRVLTPTYEVTTKDTDGRKPLSQKYTTMTLVHKAKDGKHLSSLLLRKIHYDLEQNSLFLQNSGSSNILLTKVSFDCQIIDARGEPKYDFISFDLKIPNTTSNEDPVFSFETVKKTYDEALKPGKPFNLKKMIYKNLETFYNSGKAIANPHNCLHGQTPDYKGENPKQDQYILHTEQLLVAYLITKAAINMLSNRLNNEIKAKYPGVKSATVYNMGLHMHSTKTCCAVCEYVLLGFMNHGHFKKVLRAVFADSNDNLKLSFPKDSDFKLLTTVSASTPDAHHQTIPISNQYDARFIKSFEISTTDITSSQKIFMVFLDNNFDIQRLEKTPDLDDLTVGISGSKASPGSPGTMDKTINLRTHLTQI